MTSSFLARALQAQQYLSPLPKTLGVFTPVRDQLSLVKEKFGSFIYLLVYDVAKILRVSFYVEKKADGPGFNFGIAFKRGGTWLTKIPHDVAPSMRIAEEWAIRQAILNVHRGVTAASIYRGDYGGEQKVQRGHTSREKLPT